MPEIVFVEEGRGTVTTTSGATVSTTSSATPAKPSTSESTPTTGASTELLIPWSRPLDDDYYRPGSASEDRGQLLIISNSLLHVYSRRQLRSRKENKQLDWSM